MKNQMSFKILGLAALVATVTFASAGVAQAAEETITSNRMQRTGLSGNYVGGGVGFGTGLRDDSDQSKFDGNLQGRVMVPRQATRQLPFSGRGSLLFDGDNVVAVPSVTYDFAVSDRANIYTGLGYSFVGGDGEFTPLGDKNSFIVNGGFESVLQDNFVGYTDLKLGTDSFRNNSRGTALSVQAGVGFRF